MKLLLAGVTFTLISWVFAWGQFSPLSAYTFFPLWLGYILTVNGFSRWLTGQSLLHRMGSRFILLFLISIPFWWLFEFLNLFTQNWQYLVPGEVSGFSYFIQASVNFSTVTPAVLSTAFFFSSLLRKIKPLKGKPFAIKKTTPLLLAGLSATSFLLILLLPEFSFPLLWAGVVLLFEPLNYLLKFRSLLYELSRGRLTLPVSIASAALFTGFWWELWNFYSLPKWTYSVPYVSFYKVFEMPILGYIGYLPFGLEIYSFACFSFGILKKLPLLKDI